MFNSNFPTRKVLFYVTNIVNICFFLNNPAKMSLNLGILKKFEAMSKEKEVKEKHEKKAPLKSLKEKRAAKAAKRSEKERSE